MEHPTSQQSADLLLCQLLEQLIGQFGTNRTPFTFVRTYINAMGKLKVEEPCEHPQDDLT